MLFSVLFEKFVVKYFGKVPEDPRLQRRYSFYFTVGTHLILFVFLFAQINWQINPKNEQVVSVVFEGASAPNANNNPVTTVAQKAKSDLNKAKKNAEKALQKKAETDGAFVAKKIEVKKQAEKKAPPKKEKDKKNEPKPVPEPAPKNEPKVDTLKTDLKDKDPLQALIKRTTTPDVTPSKNPTPTNPQPIAKSTPSTPNTTGKSGEGSGLGTAATGYGKSGEGTMTAGDRYRILSEYQTALKQKVRSKINYPEGITTNPEVSVYIIQNQKGEVQSVRLDKTSGVKAFDDAVVRAVQAASPLPLPAHVDFFHDTLILKWKRFE